MVRDPLERPDLERRHEGLLHHVLGQAQIHQAEDAGQGGDHLPRLVAEEMVDGTLDVGGGKSVQTSSICRSSIQPLSRWGQERQISTAWS